MFIVLCYNCLIIPTLTRIHFRCVCTFRKQSPRLRDVNVSNYRSLDCTSAVDNLRSSPKLCFLLCNLLFYQRTSRSMVKMRLIPWLILQTFDICFRTFYFFDLNSLKLTQIRKFCVSSNYVCGIRANS